MTATVTLKRMDREVPKAPSRRHRNRPRSYRWAPGYLVVNPTSGLVEYPPVSRADAYSRAREIAGPKCKVVIVDR